MKAADLRTVLDAMTPGEYRYNERLGDVESLTAGPTPHLSKGICQLYFGNADANAAGIVALANHRGPALDVVELADQLVNGPPENAHAARVALRCALAKFEAVPR